MGFFKGLWNLAVLSSLFLIIIFSAAAFAQLDPGLEIVANEDFLKFLIASIGGTPGAGAMGTVLLVVQLVVMFLKTPASGEVFKSLSGLAKYILIMVLSIVGGVIALKIQGLDLLSAIMHSSVLGLVSIGINQGLKQWADAKKANSPVIEKPIP